MVRKIIAAILLGNFFLLAFTLYQFDGDVIPIHFALNGEVDGWGSKWIYLLFSLIPLVVMVGALFYWRKQDQRQQFGENQKLYKKIIPLFCILFSLFGWAAFYLAVNSTSREGNASFMIILLGFLILILSNYLGKIRRNAWYGIRLPWTLMDDMVWDKTHRVAGYFGVLSGLILIFSGFIGYLYDIKWIIGAGITSAMILFLLVPTAYSIYLFYWIKPRNVT